MPSHLPSPPARKPPVPTASVSPPQQPSPPGPPPGNLSSIGHLHSDLPSPPGAGRPSRAGHQLQPCCGRGLPLYLRCGSSIGCSLSQLFLTMHELSTRGRDRRGRVPVPGPPQCAPPRQQINADLLNDHIWIHPQQQCNVPKGRMGRRRRQESRLWCQDPFCSYILIVGLGFLGRSLNLSEP